jgi:hypothetical protein
MMIMVFACESTQGHITNRETGCVNPKNPDSVSSQQTPKEWSIKWIMGSIVSLQ